MDRITKQKRSDLMRRVRGKDSAMEQSFRRELHKRGLRYRKNVSGLPGKPDIVFKSKGVVIFLDSCFWHGCRWHCRIPHANRAYWEAKIARNKERDMEIRKFYSKKTGWKILRVWEHELRKKREEAISRVLRMCES